MRESASITAGQHGAASRKGATSAYHPHLLDTEPTVTRKRYRCRRCIVKRKDCEAGTKLKIDRSKIFQRGASRDPPSRRSCCRGAISERWFESKVACKRQNDTAQQKNLLQVQVSARRTRCSRIDLRDASDSHKTATRRRLILLRRESNDGQGEMEGDGGLLTSEGPVSQSARRKNDCLLMLCISICKRISCKSPCLSSTI